MNMQDKARELIVQDRQHQEHVQETMLSRAADEKPVEQTDEQARELLVEERHHEEHLHEAMLSRASEQLG